MVVATNSFTRLPFVEKYRPTNLKDLVSHDDVIRTITKMADERRIPHFLLYGPPGTGKTTTMLAMARHLFGPKDYKSHVMEFNASDDRGIEVVRNNIVRFAESTAININSEHKRRLNFKLIILDEADAMTKEAQNALKRVIEKYAVNIRFCLICNHVSSIIPAIQSRCTRFRFPPLKKEQIIPRLDHVIAEEKLNVTADGKEALFQLSGGDMRKILNVLQSTSLAFDIVDRRNVYACVGQPDPQVIERIFKILLNDSLADAYEKITKLQLENAISLSDVLENMLDHVLSLNFGDEYILAALVEQLSDIQKRVTNGCSEMLQLHGLIASFVFARENDPLIQPSNGGIPQHQQTQRPFVQQPIHQQPMHQQPIHQQMPAGPQPQYVPQNQQQNERRDPTRPTIQERIQNLHPPPISIELLSNVQNMSVLQLCQIGRDITQEVSIRLLNILSVFRVGIEQRRGLPQLDSEAILVYAKFLFRKLEEVRIRIDKMRAQLATPVLDEDTFFKEITNMDPVDSGPNSSTTYNALVEQFETNRSKIIDMNNKIKKLEWLLTTSNPQLLP
ncbi:Replication factor C subunit 5 [Aphelenchoides besseyi]|nr:Replication factor C subunit 5 [Aphelenchoides besseyi]